jgi:hypothetical protein
MPKVEREQARTTIAMLNSSGPVAQPGTTGSDPRLGLTTDPTIRQ